MAADLNQPARPSWWRTIVIGRRPVFTLVRIIVLVLLVFLIRQFVLTPIQIVGPSMMPTYADRGVNLVNRLAYFSHEPARGDVVSIRTSGDHIMYMKRVIGLPGETVAFRDGHAFVNGQQLDEPYVIYPCDWNLAPVTVEPGKYLVIGDNRSMPPDNHVFGQAERRRIVGRVLLCKNLFVSWGRSR
ncbi:MAG: signal peptidase I [Verrucomicrobiota bacterium]